MPFWGNMSFNEVEFKKIIPSDDKDMIGHVNHSKYLQYLEEARWSLYKFYGYDEVDVATDEKGPIVLEANIYYRKEIFPGEEVKIISRFNGFRGFIGSMDQRILNSNQKVACRASIRFAYFDLKERKMLLPFGKWKKVHEKLLGGNNSNLV